MISKGGKIFWCFLATLLVVALWLTSSGQTYLYGVPGDVLEGLCQAKKLVPAPALSPYLFLEPLGSDILFSASLVQSLALVLGFVLSWLALYKVWNNPVSPTLTCGLLFFGAQTLWLTTSSPGQSGLVLLKALAVACIVSAKVPLLAGAVLSLAIGEPSSGVAFYLALCYLSYRRQEAYGPFVTVLSVVGIGSLLPILCGSYLLRPSLEALSLWVLLPIASLLLSPQIREARLGLYVTLIIASVLTGTPELASAICLGDLAVVGLGSKSEELETEGLVVPTARLVHILALLALIAGVLPGEQHLNRRILIPAQKSRLALHQLLFPFSLQTHAQRLDEEAWRSQTPFPGMRSQDIDLLNKLETPFRVLSPEEATEDRTLSLVYALLAEQPLQGWVTPQHLSTSSLTCRQQNKNLIAGEGAILFRQSERSRVETGPEAPKEVEKLPDLNLQSVLNLPFRSQTLATESGGAYRLKSFREDEILVFQDGPTTISLSAGPQVYQLLSLKDPENTREVVINTLQLSLQAPESQAVLPSRSLVPLEFKMTNRGDTPITSQEIKSVNLKVVQGASFSPFEQQFPSDFVLFPKEAIKVQLFLATPEAEGDYQLVASLDTIDEVTHPLPIEGETQFRTWRRLPPVGTWVEEP